MHYLCKMIMTRRIFFPLLMLLCVKMAMAVPAHRGTLRVQQPDGSYVTLRLNGDEWRHFQTTADGYSVVKDARGYYVYAELHDGRLRATSMVAHDAAGRQAAEQQFLSTVQKYQAPEMTAGTAAMKQRVEQREAQKRGARRAGADRAAQYDYSNFRGLVILVEFNDKSFSRADYHDIADNMINKEGYTGYVDTNGRKQTFTGSVRDYFSDQSNGKFKPQFDVCGPYKVGFSQYDPHGSEKSADIISAVLDSADVDINYKDYDRDGDGFVDLVYFIFAGNGANYNENDERLWWPHRSVIYNPHATSWSDWMIRKDGVAFYDYASSVELYGYTKAPSTVTIDGIGTICHEFSHVLGLPDFYDTDYEESGGESAHPDIWSLMAGGSYENIGRTPVGYSLYERWSVGFLDDADIETISGEGNYTLAPLHSGLKGYRIDTPVRNEFFLFENRQKTGFKWDAYLPGSGMLVHRVDLTNNRVWDNNTVNANPSHNYYEVVRARGPQKTQGYYVGSASDVFPGTGRVTELHSGTTPASLKSWSGQVTQWGLFDIQLVNGVVTFEVRDALTLKSLSLPPTAVVGTGVALQLDATPEPDYAQYTLTWTSSNPQVATVTDEGLVYGVAPGTAVITVRSQNGLTATCTVTVEDMAAYDVAAFKAMDAGTAVLLQLTDATVLFANATVVYVRDAKGCVSLHDTGLSASQGDVLNGRIYVQVVKENNMVRAAAVDGVTNAAGLTVTAGPGVQPREVTIEQLSGVEYGDYVVLRAVQLKRDGGIWAISGDHRILVGNPFLVSGTIPMNTTGKYYDVEAILGTELLDGQVVDELYRVKAPVQVSAPTAVSTVRADEGCPSVLYNVQGQRVDASWRGLVIRNGRKYLAK